MSSLCNFIFFELQRKIDIDFAQNHRNLSVKKNVEKDFPHALKIYDLLPESTHDV